MTTDASGGFEIDGVATGKQTVRASHPDYTEAVQTVDVGDEGATVTLRMAQGDAIAGTVSSDTGQPVAGASVSLLAEGGGAVNLGGPGGGIMGRLGGAQDGITDAAGRFRFEHLSAGRYTVTAALGSHTAAPVSVALQAGQSQEGVALRLETGVTIQGTVSGLPGAMLTGTRVSANGADSYMQMVSVGSDGRFTFEHVPFGAVTLRGNANDGHGSMRTAAVQVTATAEQSVVSAELVFPDGFALSGRITQAGQPVAGAMVAASQQGNGRQAAATSDDTGSYRLEGLQEGTYAVIATAPAGGSPPQRRTVTIRDDQTLDITLPSATIAGKVVDSESKAPLANAIVALAGQARGGGPRGGARPVTTDSNGQFSFSGLEEAPFTLSTTRPDYQLDERTVTASEAGTDGLVIALRRGAGLGIRVLDGLLGVPLRAVSVCVLTGGGAPVVGPLPITLDSDGNGEIASLPPGTYTVLATSSGYATVRLDGVNAPAALVAIALTPGGTVLIQAGAKTQAAEPVTATLVSVTGQPALLSLLNRGGRVGLAEPTVRLRNVPPGSYVLTLPATSGSQSFTVGEGGVATVQLP
jgi:hypothetical protein